MVSCAEGYYARSRPSTFFWTPVPSASYDKVIEVECIVIRFRPNNGVLAKETKRSHAKSPSG